MTHLVNDSFLWNHDLQHIKALERCVLYCWTANSVCLTLLGKYSMPTADGRTLFQTFCHVAGSKIKLRRATKSTGIRS